MDFIDESTHSSYREKLFEHIFLGELMRVLWAKSRTRLEVLMPQVDNSGYDLVIECGSLLRHVQLKTTHTRSTVRSVNVNSALASKPSGCVICITVDINEMKIISFRWFGGEPGEPLPNITVYPISKHAKANAQGVKLERPGIRKVPFSAFDKIPPDTSKAEPLADMLAVAAKLFGDSPHTGKARKGSSSKRR